MADEKRPIIIVKKKGGHGGHHGGAWKVAYADFVTAMMALFIVLWLLNSSKQVQEAVGGYFKDPTGTSKKVGSNQTGSGENFAITKENISELKEELQKAVRHVANFDKFKDQIQMTVTAEGLRIELLETEAGTFFDSGRPELNSSGKDLLITLAAELGKLPNKVSIEGHTDSRPYTGNGAYSNWELSVDRANSARRLMQANGVRADQVSQVRGYADQQLRKAADPEDPSNRRITLIVQYVAKNSDDEDQNPDAKDATATSPKLQAEPAGGEKSEKQEPAAQKK
jgi:chemotaxis protein MotB